MAVLSPYVDIPTYDNDHWTTTTFSSREKFKEFLTPLFKKPGTVEFDDVSSAIINVEGQK